LNGDVDADPVNAQELVRCHGAAFARTGAGKVNADLGVDESLQHLAERVFVDCAIRGECRCISTKQL
jgi:hypothetical protein